MSAVRAFFVRSTFSSIAARFRRHDMTTRAAPYGRSMVGFARDKARQVRGSFMEPSDASFACCDVACRVGGAGAVRSGLGAAPIVSSSLPLGAAAFADACGEFRARRLRLCAGVCDGRQQWVAPERLESERVEPKR